MDQSNFVNNESLVPKHFSELHTVFRRTSFVFLLSTLISTIWLENLVFDWVLSQSTSSEISVYGPYDWIEMRLLSIIILSSLCLLYTSDAADDLLCVDLGGRRIIKKKKKD